jgi:hypothetical protein
LSSIEIEALRQILIALRKKYSRSAIVTAADIDPADLDNFLNRRTQDEKAAYRTKTPHNAFQRRMINYLFADRDITDEVNRLGQADSALAQGLSMIFAKRARYAALPDEDYYFEYLASIRAVTAQRCRSVCNELAGHYELYRFSSESKIHKSHLTIAEYNPYMKVPYFLNRIALSSRQRRVIVGNVYELGSNYFFHGFILRNERTAMTDGEYLGSKVMILQKLEASGDSELTLTGFGYTSGSHELYDIGAMRAIRTNSTFKSEEVGILDCAGASQQEIDDRIKAYNLPFDLKEIALMFPEVALRDKRIYSALRFNMSASRRERARRR